MAKHKYGTTQVVLIIPFGVHLLESNLFCAKVIKRPRAQICDMYVRISIKTILSEMTVDGCDKIECDNPLS